VRNRKTGQIVYKYPRWRRVLIYAASSGSIAVLVCCVVIIFIYCYLINFVAEYWDCNYGAGVGAVLHSTLIIVMGSIYKMVATWLNDQENHRTDLKYENSLIFKIFLFEVCNNFLAMFWIAFLSSYFCDLDLTPSLTDVPEQDTCRAKLEVVQSCDDLDAQIIAQLQLKLGTLFITRAVAGRPPACLVLTERTLSLAPSARAGSDAPRGAAALPLTAGARGAGRRQHHRDHGADHQARREDLHGQEEGGRGAGGRWRRGREHGCGGRRRPASAGGAGRDAVGARGRRQRLGGGSGCSSGCSGGRRRAGLGDDRGWRVRRCCVAGRVADHSVRGAHGRCGRPRRRGRGRHRG
jgi:hypothetical protein